MRTRSWQRVRLALLLCAGALATVGGGSGADAPSSAGAPGSPPRPRRPNIVLIVADDLGYCDLACYGSKTIRTPYIDGLGRAGMRFTDAYVTAPVCAPSRVGLLTGRYQQRCGFENNTGPMRPETNETIGLPLSERTIADALSKAGYATGLVGKWHLGAGTKFHPMNRGFTEFFGFVGPGEDGVRTILRNRNVITEPEYLSDAFTRESLAFIERHKREPFFLVASYSAPHTPLVAPAKYQDRFRSLPEGNVRTYAAMVASVDDGVGAILKKLETADLLKNTLIVFMSDNGCYLPTNACSNAPFQGGKFLLMEGGIRVPLLVQWPGHVRAGSTQHQPVISLDLFPTILAVTGAAAAPGGLPLDGVSLLPLLTGARESLPERALFWRLGPNRAVRKGNWKLFRGGNSVTWLFDLSVDAGESRDLSKANAGIAANLDRELSAWSATLPSPLWPNQRGAVKVLVNGAIIDVPM